MNVLKGFKIGDTVHFAARLSVTEEGVDVTEETDFSAWRVECQYKNPSGVVVHHVADPFVTPGGPVIDCSLPSSVSSTLQANLEYSMDVRVKDENAVVRSTATRKFKLEPAVSETPL